MGGLDEGFVDIQRMAVGAAEAGGDAVLAGPSLANGAPAVVDAVLLELADPLSQFVDALFGARAGEWQRLWHGVIHHYAPLAILSKNNITPIDLRRILTKNWI